MKIVRLPTSIDQETARSERNYYEFLAELRIISNRYGLAFRTSDGLWAFDPDSVKVRYEQDSRGVLTPKFDKAADEAVELP
jgi:hypothetical protein